MSINTYFLNSKDAEGIKILFHQNFPRENKLYRDCILFFAGCIRSAGFHSAAPHLEIILSKMMLIIVKVGLGVFERPDICVET